MGKTIRRKTLKNKGYYFNRRQAPDGVSGDTVADNLFHSDKPKSWRGINPSVKEDQNAIARSARRRIRDARDFDELDTINNDQVYARKANACYQHS